MKKFAVGMLSAALIIGAGTAVFAAENGSSSKGLNFEQMLPFMQKMHPNLSNGELNQMYKSCNGNGGMMNTTNGKTMDSNNMMNRF